MGAPRKPVPIELRSGTFTTEEAEALAEALAMAEADPDLDTIWPHNAQKAHHPDLSILFTQDYGRKYVVRPAADFYIGCGYADAA